MHVENDAARASRHQVLATLAPAYAGSSWRWHSGAAIPPIEVYRVGDQDFVSDGHHRVSIAAATGQNAIDAYVIKVLTNVPSTAQRAHSTSTGCGRVCHP